MDNLFSEYARSSRRRLLLLALAALLVALATVRDISTGAAGLSAGDVLSAIFAPGSVSPTARAVVWSLRLPGALTAMCVGASLGLAGAVMQTILANPLASPYTLGVGAGAAFGASLAIVLDLRIAALPPEYTVPALSFAFASLVCALVAVLGRSRGGGSSAMILAGIALLFLFQALQALLQFFATEGDLQAIVFWTFGSLQKAAWPKLAVTGGILAVCLPLTLRDAWRYTALLLGDEKAESLGVNTGALKTRAFFIVSLLTASAVCFTGTIGFVGLAGPHIARALAGDDQRFYLPLSSLCGALILCAASAVSKSVVRGAIFPIGVITALTGVPFFFALVLRRRRYQ